MTDGPNPDLSISTIIEAPIERVYEAWTDPDLFAQWFGTRQTLVPRESVHMDVRPGGSWSATMQMVNGTDIRWKGEYLEVDRGRHLAFTMSDDESGPMERVTVDMTRLGDETAMVMTRSDGSLERTRYEEERAAWIAYFDSMEDLLAG